VPYVKISRDKRGYETYYLLEAPSDRSRQSRPRILFWFRTPPQVKVGREPFSEEIRQAIESQNPDLKFDWPRLMSMQPPPIDVQRWRERRRLERAVRQAAREAPEAEAEVAEVDRSGAEDIREDVPIDDLDTPRHSIDAAVDADAHLPPEAAPPAERPAAEAAVSADSTSDGRGASSSSTRRRRRRRRGRRHGQGQGQTQADGAAPEPPSPGSPPSSEEV
jgi:hypothetical protein